MALSTLYKTRIAGVASAVPKEIISNSDYTVISPEQREKIIKYTGIQYRRWARREVCCSDLCFAAAEKLLSELGWNRDEIGAIIFVTQTPDYPYPASAQILQDRLKLPESCIAYDINLGCSGYTYGLFLLGTLLESSGIRKGLLLAGDASKTMGDHDPASAILFGHAASATAMEFSPENNCPLYFEMGSDGNGFEVICVPGGGCRNPLETKTFERQDLEGGGARGDLDVILDAAEIINFTMREIPPSLDRLLTYCNRTREEIDAYLFHQANGFINKQVARKAKLRPEQVPSSLYNFGNTSSATIPLTLTTEFRERLNQGPAKVVMSGFGVGLSWASVYWEADGGVFPELVEV